MVQSRYRSAEIGGQAWRRSASLRMGAFQRRLVFTSPTSIRYLLSYVLFLCLGTIFFVLLPMEERRTGLVRDFRPSTWAVLREYGFTEAAVAAMPSQYVPNVVRSYSRAKQKGQSKVLLIHVQHGLSNRIRGYLSAKAFANATGRHLRVIWILDEHCRARFADLFLNDEDVADTFVEDEVSGANYDSYDYMLPATKYQFMEDGPRHIYVRSAFLLNGSTGAGQDASSLARQFQELDPVDSIKDALRPYHAAGCHVAREWWPCIAYVGVHIRQGQIGLGEEYLGTPEDVSTYSPEDRAALNLARAMTATAHFVHELRALVARNTGLSIFVASDTARVEDELMHEFGGRVITLGRDRRCTQLERDVGCLRAALADILMLAHSSHPAILGSHWSSFTEVAALAHSKRILRASVDFQAPGLAPLICNPSSLYALPAFEGVSICAALNPLYTDLLMVALPTWLAAIGVHEILVLDYMPGDNKRLAAAVAGFEDPRLKYVKVQGTGKFAITRAYNFAARHSRGSRILKLDADSILLPKFVEHHPHVGGIYYAGNWKAARSENERHLNGVLFVDRATWAAANGFDERIVGYGHDDDNLQMRLSRLATRRDLDFNYIRHVEHGDGQRADNTRGIPFIDVSNLFNAALTERLELWHDKMQGSQYECAQQLDGTCDCNLTAPVPDIHSGLSPEDERSYLLEAYRKVVGYSVDLPEAKLATVTSLEWLQGQLRIHYQKVRRPWVVLRPNGTCPDRTAAVASGRLLADKLGWPLRVIWQKDEQCGASLGELLTAEVDVMESFFPWEENYKYKAFDLTVGPDWILPSTDFSRVKKSLFIHARGPFGEALFSPDALAAAYAALLPRPRAAPEQLPRPESPLLLVELTGPLAERLLDLARAVLLSQKLSRRLVLLWDSADVGGVELGEIVDAPYLVLSPGELETAAALPPTELLTVTVSAVDVFSRPDGTEHVKVPDVSDVDASRIGEEQLNSMVGSLRPAFPLKEATHKLLVGRNFRGLLVDRSAPCDERALHASLKASLMEAGATNGSYFAAIAPAPVCARLKALGVMCARWCHAESGRECHLRQLAMTLALAQLKVLYFTSWTEKTVDYILRRSLIPGVLVDCNSASTDTPGQLFRPALAYNLEPGSKPPARRTVCPTEGLHLVTQYPVLKRNDSGPRQAEFTATLEANLAHDQIAAVHLLLESRTDETVIRASFSDPCDKLHVSFLGRRLYYSDAIAYANERLPGKLCAQAHADISFGEGLEFLSADRHLAGGRRVLALSRHERTESEVCGRDICYRYEHSEEGFLSSDAFVFVAPLPQSVVDQTGFAPQSGSENVVIWALKRAGLDVRNPCRTLRIFHNHCSGDRSTLANAARSWEHEEEQDARLDLKLCDEIHCGDGYCENGPEVLEDLDGQH